ncbi:MAG: peptidylprolyl isomerase [Bacillales bacterium]|nr:peptidylprolyl isomerase [Bacillales bacterium]
MVILRIKNYGEIKIEIDYSQAKNTASNFVSLVKNGFYNGLTFHRVIEGFMIQGGDPKGNGTGGPGYSIKGEFSSNGIENNLKHTRGVISMARAMNPNSAGSQFFIMHKDAPFLDGQYAAFGIVKEGIEVVDKIAKARTSLSDRPLTPIVIEEAIAVDEPDYEVIKM